jgi:hypothetical protein
MPDDVVADIDTDFPFLCRFIFESGIQVGHYGNYHMNMPAGKATGNPHGFLRRVLLWKYRMEDLENIGLLISEVLAASKSPTPLRAADQKLNVSC